LIKINDEVYGILKNEDTLYNEKLKPGQNYFFYVKDVTAKQTGD
jgi:transcription antitermination factor NusA-like protein